MYFESKKVRKIGLPWLRHLTPEEEAKNDYFDRMSEIAEQIDRLEMRTTFTTMLQVSFFGTAFAYVMARIRELKRHLKHARTEPNVEALYDELCDLNNELADEEGDAVLYENYTGPDVETDGDWEDDDCEDFKDDGHDTDDDDRNDIEIDVSRYANYSWHRNPWDDDDDNNWDHSDSWDDSDSWDHSDSWDDVLDELDDFDDW